VPERLQLFATAARGTEPLLAEELEELGATKVRQDRGGVRFAANWTEALRICLWTRIAMRVLQPLGEAEAIGAAGVYAAAAEIPWEEHLTAASTFAVEATLKDSEHSHSGFVALKIKDAIVDRLRQKLGKRPDVDVKNPAVRVVARLAKQKLSVALDLAGEPLHRRGYRRHSGEAPLKETLAAAMLRAASYRGEEPVLDPMCGSGTLLVEAGLIATHRAPGLSRKMGVERWPRQGAEASRLLDELRAEARGALRKAPFPIRGLDRDEAAVDATRKNASAAGLADLVRVEVGDATQPPAADELGPGLLITNPPYGARLTAGGQKGMKTFYFKLGESLGTLPGWRLYVLTGNPAFESAFHRRPSSARTLWNGPIECRLLGYEPKRT
jgi:putative N6-adenine-specific DNA methylase